MGEIRSHAKFQVSSFNILKWQPLFVNQSWHWDSHLKWPESGIFDLAPFIGIKNALQNGITLRVLDFRKYVKRLDGNWWNDNFLKVAVFDTFKCIFHKFFTIGDSRGWGKFYFCLGIDRCPWKKEELLQTFIRRRRLVTFMYYIYIYIWIQLGYDSQAKKDKKIFWNCCMSARQINIFNNLSFISTF